MFAEIKIFLRTWREELVISFIILLVALLAFGLGRLSVLYEREGEFEILYPPNQEAAALQAVSFQVSAFREEEDSTQANLPSPPVGGGGYVASKTGAKYHLPWCSGAQRIKEENKVYFETKAEAEAAGYTAAGNCKGI